MAQSRRVNRLKTGRLIAPTGSIGKLGSVIGHSHRQCILQHGDRYCTVRTKLQRSRRGPRLGSVSHVA